MSSLKQEEEEEEEEPVNHNDFDSEDFTLIDEVEWGPRKDEDGYDTDQTLAPKPRRQPVQDACGCFPPKTGRACLDESCILYACREECRSNCDAGHLCGNKRLQRKEFCKIQVFDAGEKGKGLRLATDAPQPARKGDLICEYTGRAIREGALNRLFRRYQLDRRLYIMALGDGIFLDARKKGGIARYINHSCRPNCKVERWNVKGVMRAAVIAICDVEPGEELCFDYQWERKRGRAPTVCHCGVPECRGTLEMPKSLEEQDMQREFEGHWEQHTSGRVDETVVNRTVQIYSQEHKEYFLGEVTGYDADKGLHRIFYRQDMTETWEDLNKEDWMILNEKFNKEHFIIAKKAVKRRSSPTTSLLTAVESHMKPVLTKNYLYVQTPIKEAFWSHHLIERCQRNCNVLIQAEQMARPPLPPAPNDPEDAEKYAALDESLDGTVWKLTITGSDVPKAHGILEKNVAYLEKKLAMEAAAKASIKQEGVRPLEASVTPLSSDAHEVIFPRIIADAVKRNLPSVREKCRSVEITFVASESKSKQFSKLILEGSLLSDIESAKEHLWNFLLTICNEAKAPLSPNKIPLNLGFLGGALSSEQFNLLLSSSSNRNNSSRRRLSLDANEDLNASPFFRSFEGTLRCTVWVQSQDDQGRIDSSNRIVNEATPDTPRKLYFGCRPKEVASLVNAIQTRASDLARGVEYLYLGGDRVYIKLMLKDGSRFFNFVRLVTGASVAVDSMTGDHLRIDGRLSAAPHEMLDSRVMSMSEIERTSLADDIVRLQVECFRDECIREQPWIFGRDWNLKVFPVEGSDSGARATASVGKLTRRTACHCGMEIAEIVAALALDVSVGGHAAIILYRFVNADEDFSTQIRNREAILACIFLASKAQKTSKWKRLDAVLEAGYQTFYSGTRFNADSEEAKVLEERVLVAEKEILETVQYDIFCRDTGWITTAATRTGKFPTHHIKSVFDFAFSGQVLSAGAELWLKYGVEYVFAVAAAFLKSDLAALLPALSLIPLKVSRAAELLVETASFGRPSTEQTPSNRLLEGGKENLEKYLERINQSCLDIMSKESLGNGAADMEGVSAVEQRYRIIGQQSRQLKKIREIPSDLVTKSILPCLESVAAESCCRLYVESSGQGKEDIVLDGSWRAIEIADNLLRSHVATLPSAVNFAPTEIQGRPSEQAKILPGFLSTADIETANGWEGTMQAQPTDSDSSTRIGGKSCVAGKVGESALRKAGLRWWIPTRYAAVVSGSIAEMFALRSCPSRQIELLNDLAQAVAVDTNAFPSLTSSSKGQENQKEERYMPVSVQRWPPEKVAKKEATKHKKSKSGSMQVGFSPAALQEMQLLRQLHAAISTPQGHPNFVVPVGVAFPNGPDALKEAVSTAEESNGDKGNASADPIFSLFRSNEDNAKAAKRKKQVLEGANIVFHPTPFVLHRFMSRKMRTTEDLLIKPSVLAAWFHDCLSALVHCHANNVILRSVQSEQFVVDQCGVVKLGAMYRATVLSAEDLKRSHEVVAEARSHRKERKEQKSRKNKDDDDDFAGNPYVAPEILLGCPKHSQASDVWAIGCLLANLLLNKQLFVGKDRSSLLTSQYKIIGTPSKGSYARDLPNYEYTKPAKKYKRGVEKAFEHLLKEQASQHSKAIELIARMLHLDPKERCTAAEALGHDYITSYVENCASDSFRQQFASDWITLKRRMMESSELDRQMKDDEKSRKRAAMIVAAAKPEADGEPDDLYDIDDILMSSPPKKTKTSAH